MADGTLAAETFVGIVGEGVGPGAAYTEADRYNAGTAEPNPEDVQGSSGHTRYAALSVDDALGHDDFARNNVAVGGPNEEWSSEALHGVGELRFDAEVVTHYNDSQTAAVIPAYRDDDLEAVVEVSGCNPICIKEAAPQNPPFTALCEGVSGDWKGAERQEDQT